MSGFCHVDFNARVCGGKREIQKNHREIELMLNPMPEVSIWEIENIDILCPPVLLHTPTHPTLEMDNVKQTPNS